MRPEDLLNWDKAQPEIRKVSEVLEATTMMLTPNPPIATTALLLTLIAVIEKTAKTPDNARSLVNDMAGQLPGLLEAALKIRASINAATAKPEGGASDGETKSYTA